MKVIDADTMRNIDYQAIHNYKIPSIVLMEHAANVIYQQLIKTINKDDKIYVVCGFGNNGGDGLALARLLYDHGYQVRIYLDEKHKLSNDTMQELAILKHYPIEISDSFDISGSNIIIDCLFGTGLSRDISGDLLKYIELINNSDAYIYSIDIPSGINSDNGHIMGGAIKCHQVFCIQAIKKGMLINEGKKYCRNLIVVDINIPQVLLDEAKGITYIDDDLVKNCFPQRYFDSHKGSYGKVLMIGGSLSMHGAVTMSAKACLNSGVGLLTLFIPDVIYLPIAMKLDECMLVSAKSENGYFSIDACKQLEAIIHNYDLIVIGNGMGRGPHTSSLLQVAINSNIAMIIDGDAIYEYSKLVNINHQQEIILTPHVKEMSYLCKQSINDIKDDPDGCLNQYLKQDDKLVIALKDTYTYIANRNECYVSTSGHHGLAKGGSGDVLCGMIAGLYAQSKKALDSCICGVYLHGKLASLLVEKIDANSLLANDLIDHLKEIYLKMR